MHDFDLQAVQPLKAKVFTAYHRLCNDFTTCTDRDKKKHQWARERQRERGRASCKKCVDKLSISGQKAECRTYLSCQCWVVLSRTICLVDAICSWIDWKMQKGKTRTRLLLKGGEGSSSIFSIYCSGQCYKMLQTLGFQKYGVVYRAINPVPLSKWCLTGVQKGSHCSEDFCCWAGVLRTDAKFHTIMENKKTAKWWTKNL